MIIYYFILLIFTINTALASNLDKPNHAVNPLDELAHTQPTHCLSDSDTELDEDDDMQDNSNNGWQNEKRPLDKPEANPQSEKKAKIYRFNCPYANCNFMSDHSINIKKHIRIHTGEKPYSCNHQGCTYAAAQQEDLATHVNTIHQPIKEKVVENKLNDMTQAKKPLGKKRFKCGYVRCNYSTNFQGNLTVHKRTHTGSRPFKCKFVGCNYATTTASHLTVHIRTHTGEKPYKCPYKGCKYATGNPSSFNNHKKKVHRNDTIYNSNNSSVISLLINAGKNKNN